MVETVRSSHSPMEGSHPCHRNTGTAALHETAAHVVECSRLGAHPGLGTSNRRAPSRASQPQMGKIDVMTNTGGVVKQYHQDHPKVPVPLK